MTLLALPSAWIWASSQAEVDERILRDRIGAWIAERHLDPEDFDVDVLVGETQEAMADEVRGGALQQWLSQRLWMEFYSFASIHARPDPRARYRLPFDREVPRFLSQGIGGRASHTGDLRYSFDFVMPVGTPVLCARNGRVVRVVDGFSEAGLEAKYSELSNRVVVLHADGTFAEYLHLRSGIPVEPGDQLKHGDLIGYSGNTGYSSFPHLHLSVHRLQSGKTPSVPIRFGRGRGFVPKERSFYGGFPPATLKLRILADGVVVGGEEPLRLARGASKQLVVERVSPAGKAEDVTRAPQTRFFALSPWNLRVSKTGLLVASADPDFAALEGLWPLGLVGVRFDEGDEERGGATVTILFDEE
jgi:murein DD-endopeptidase MepM/ murein hydrolase activator NlpD